MTEHDSDLMDQRKQLSHGWITRIYKHSKSGKLIAIYLGAIVAANLSVAYFDPSASIVNAFLFIGLDLSSRDSLHDTWKRGLLWKMALLIAAGSGLSYLLNRNAGPIAVASLVAFSASATVDAIVYHLLKDRARLLRVNGSNILGAAVDSVIFPSLAFGWPPTLAIVAGQFIAKVAGGFLWSLILRKRGDLQALGS